MEGTSYTSTQTVRLLDPVTESLQVQAVNVLAVAGQVTKADLVDGAMLTTFSGPKLKVSVKDDVYTIIGPVNNVTVTAFDIRDCNSIVHVTDTAILPLVCCRRCNCIGQTHTRTELPTRLSATQACLCQLRQSDSRCTTCGVGARHVVFGRQ